MRRPHWSWHTGPSIIGFTCLGVGIWELALGVIELATRRDSIPLAGGTIGFVALYASAATLVNTPNAVKKAFKDAIPVNAVSGGCTQCEASYVAFENRDLTSGIIVWHTAFCVGGQRQENRTQERESLI